MDNGVILKQLGYKLTGNEIIDNMMLTSQMGINNNSIVLQDGSTVAKQDNFYNLFNYENWETLTVEQKITILNWAMQNYLTENGIEEKPQICFFEKNAYKYEKANAYLKNNKMVLNVERINFGNGYDCLSTIIHETVHYIDSLKRLETIEKLQPYLKDKDSFEEIMKLSLVAELYNYQTGEKELISKELKADILMLKNSFVGSSVYHSGLKINNTNLTNEMFNKYIDNLFYVTCPLEVNAYNSAYEYISDIYFENGSDNLEDLKILQAQEKKIEFIENKIVELEKLYGNEKLRTILNKEIVYRYNVATYGDEKEKYICKNLMQEREKQLEKSFKTICENIKE